MSRPNDVSVIIVNFNGREFTPACLETIPAGTETVVVDNGSKDGSADEIAARFPQATLIRNTVNRGFAAAVNQGVAATRGRYVCLLNNDARLSADTLATLVAYLDAHPDVGMAAPQLLHEDCRKQHSFDNFPSLATVFLNKSLLRLLAPGKYPSKKQEYTEPREVESVIGACMMVRRDLIDRIGPLDEAYFLFLEETDWCLRAWRSGSKVAFVPASRVVHLQGKTRDQVRFRARIEYTRSLFTFFAKQRRPWHGLVRLFFPLRNLLEFVFQLFGLFTAKGRRRWAETAAVLGWQLCGCPRGWGLSTGADLKYMTLRDGTRVLEDHAEAFNDFDGKRRAAKTVKDLRLKRTLEYPAGGKTFLIKVYKPGSWGRRLKAMLGGSRARHEYSMSLGLHLRGIPTVPVAALREGGGERWVAFEKLEGWSQLQGVLLSPGDSGTRRRLCRAYGRFARRLLDAGVWQYDFNPSNILVKGQAFKVIDFEKMDLRPAISLGERLRLIAKMNRIPGLFRTDRLRFLKGYLDCSLEERGRGKAIAGEILRLYRLQLDHDDERSTRRCLDESRDFGLVEAGEWRGHYLKRRPERPGGLTLEEARALAGQNNGGFRTEAASDAIESWKKACREARKGQVPPLAVLVRKGETRGSLFYPGS